MNLLILTFANDDTFFLQNLVSSLKKYNYNYKVLGLGKKWVNFMTKIKTCYNYLNNSILDDNYIISIVDAYDVLACDYDKTIINKFLSFNTDIVIGAESTCGGNCTPLNKFFKYKNVNNNKIKYKYANGGFYIGYKKSVVKMLKYILSLGIDDDQIAIGKYMNKYSENVELDTDGSLISNVTHGSYFDTYCINNKIKNIKTNKYPCFVHTPGIHFDLHYRMDYYGNKILGKQYKKYSFKQKISCFYNKYNTKVNYIVLFIFVLLILFLFLFL